MHVQETYHSVKVDEAKTRIDGAQRDGQQRVGYRRDPEKLLVDGGLLLGKDEEKLRYDTKLERSHACFSG